MKSLVRFHCVSKQWSSLITNSIMTWSLVTPRLLVIFDCRALESSVISLSRYPLSTNRESVSAEQDGHALVRGIGYCNIMYQYIRGLICCLTRSSQFCMIRASQTFEESYQVFTLGDPKKQWRIIRGFGTFLSPTMTTRVCINFDLNKVTNYLAEI